MEEVRERKLPCIGTDGEDYVLVVRTSGTGTEAKTTYAIEDGRSVSFLFRSLYRIDATGMDLVCYDPEEP